MTLSDFLTVENVSEILGVSQVSVRKWLKDGKLNGSRAGKKWLIPKEELQKFLGEDVAKVNKITTENYLSYEEAAKDVGVDIDQIYDLVLEQRINACDKKILKQDWEDFKRDVEIEKYDFSKEEELNIICKISNTINKRSIKKIEYRKNFKLKTKGLYIEVEDDEPFLGMIMIIVPIDPSREPMKIITFEKQDIKD